MEKYLTAVKGITALSLSWVKWRVMEEHLPELIQMEYSMEDGQEHPYVTYIKSNKNNINAVSKDPRRK